MITLNAKIIRDNKVLNETQKFYNNEESFYIAYVEICYDLDITVPFWSSKEEKLLKENKEITFLLDKDRKLVLSAS